LISIQTSTVSPSGSSAGAKLKGQPLLHLEILERGPFAGLHCGVQVERIVVGWRLVDLGHGLIDEFLVVPLRDRVSGLEERSALGETFARGAGLEDERARREEKVLCLVDRV